MTLDRKTISFPYHLFVLIFAAMGSLMSALVRREWTESGQLREPEATPLFFGSRVKTGVAILRAAVLEVVV